MSKRMLIMLAACLVVFGGVFFMKFMGKKAMNDYFNNQPQETVTILATTARKMDWSRHIPSVGSLVPANGTQITTEADGIVEAIHFEPGQEVAEGDLLITLKADTERAELERLEAEAKIAAISLRRANDLQARKALSQSDVDEANARAAAAQAAADAQRARLEQKLIRAPFAGRLGIRRVNVGQYLSPGTALVSLQALDPMEVEFALPEALLSQVSTGLEIGVSVDAWPGETFSGVIKVIQPEVETETRNFRLRGSLANPEQKLRAGMFGRITIHRPGSHSVVAIPRTAISYDSYGTSVYALRPAEDNAEQLVAKQRFIRVGKANGDFVEVLEGLEDGERVAAGGLLKLRNGTPVKIDDSKPLDPSLDPDVANS